MTLESQTMDEIERVASLVQDAATGDAGVSPSDVAIVVPSRDPWTKWLERSGIPCNGLTTRPLREGAAGAAVPQVLLGEQFGGRHHRHLMPAADGLQAGKRRHERLAATDVPLHEAEHGHVSVEITPRAW